MGHRTTYNITPMSDRAAQAYLSGKWRCRYCGNANKYSPSPKYCDQECQKCFAPKNLADRE